VGRVARLSPQHYPQLVTFRDIRDPKSIEIVDPNNMAASLGPGVTLQSITVSVTSDDLTEGIEKKLPSYGPSSGFDTWYQSLSFSDPRRITLEDFKRGK
jgi:hypothetical protein